MSDDELDVKLGFMIVFTHSQCVFVCVLTVMVFVLGCIDIEMVYV